MFGQVRRVVEPDIHPGRPVWAARTGELTEALLLARQEADVVGLPCNRQERGVQGASRADDFVPTGRVHARNGTGDEVLGDPVI
jgi:hypothetical protein